MKLVRGDRAGLWPILNRFGVLSDIPEASQPAFLAAGHRINVAAGQTAQIQGEASRGLSGVLQGQFRFSSVDEVGREFIFYITFPGMWFGQSMFDDEPTLGAATAMVESEVFFLPADRVHSLIAADHSVALFVIRSLTWAGRTLYRRLRERITLPNAAVIASLLSYHLAERPPWHGGLGRDGLGRDGLGEVIHLSQAEIASMCGISLKTVNRILSDLKGKGVVDISYNAVTVHDGQALARLAACVAPEDVAQV